MINNKLPMFAYGSLKTGQLAHKQIAQQAKSIGSSSVEGFELIVVDGIARANPLIGATVWGEIFELTELGYSQVNKFELASQDLYRWEEVVTDKGPANMLVNNLPGIRSRHDHVESWSATDDPFFAYCIPWSYEKLLSIKSKMDDSSLLEFGRQCTFLELQAQFTILWSLFERITLFQEGPQPTGETLIDRVRQVRHITEWRDAVEQADIDANLGSRSNSQPSGNATYAGGQGFPTWHKKRNNIIHRGKSAQKEFTGLYAASRDMHNTLAMYLQLNQMDINKLWNSLTVELDKPYSSRLYQIPR